MYPAPGPLGAPRQSGVARVLVPLLLVVALPLGAALTLHNGLVAKREAVDAAWAQVESNYHRRADLVPALAASVRRYMQHESETLEQVVAARNQAFADAAPPTPVALKVFQASQAEIGRGIRQVLALAESYPELRSADQFLELQAQLEGSENRINVARMGFNEAVRAYNAALDQFPTSYIARARGYERHAYFQTDEAARHAPSLGFD